MRPLPLTDGHDAPWLIDELVPGEAEMLDSEDVRSSLLDPARAHVAAGLEALRKPTDRRPLRYTKPPRCRTATYPAAGACERPERRL